MSRARFGAGQAAAVAALLVVGIGLAMSPPIRLRMRRACLGFRAVGMTRARRRRAVRRRRTVDRQPAQRFPLPLSRAA